MEKKTMTFKQLGNLIKLRSISFLDAFFNDTADKRNQSEKTEEFRRVLQQAAKNESLVVLQVQGEKIGTFETVSGRIVGHTVGKEQVILKLQNNQQQLRMVSISTIRKLSILTAQGRTKAVK